MRPSDDVGSKPRNWVSFVILAAGPGAGGDYCLDAVKWVVVRRWPHARTGSGTVVGLNAPRRERPIAWIRLIVVGRSLGVGINEI